MEETGANRRLAAILAADMVGYSRLMGDDEAGTLARLRTHRLELIDPTIAKCRGRIIKTTGDGMLVEFASVVDAVTCAAEIQRRMARRNVDVAPDRRIEYRIGINLGDIIVEDDDIFGDGVNVAARLQEIAEPGGLCVSGAVLDQIHNRTDVTFEDLGQPPLKNIARPVHVHRARLGDVGAELAAAASAAVDATAVRPSIVVLPLVNMSPDPEQELFADGMTEDILTELSRFRHLDVISRNTSFAFKGRAMKVGDVARELGVQYVLEGSVRKAGNRVRISVQLIDATSDRHLWAERYDRDREDLFAIQDEVTRAIVGILPGRVEAAVRDRATKKPTTNMTAYELVLAGKTLHHRRTRDDNSKALDMLDRALALDPDFAHAHAWKACVLGQAYTNGYVTDRDATWRTLTTELDLALGLDDNDSDVHRILAAVNTDQNKLEQAAYHQDRALALNPNDDLIVVQQGEILTWLGQAEEGIAWVRKAMRLNPYHPERYWGHLGRAYFVARRYAEAVEAFRHVTAPDNALHANLAACLAHAGNDTAAKDEAALVLRADPGFTVAAFLATLHYGRAQDVEHHRAGLLKAGLPA
ncbi:MAG: adenylate/guanylate cyclase domain-containing protein [Alphaproteobacteria bacterium]